MSVERKLCEIRSMIENIKIEYVDVYQFEEYVESIENRLRRIEKRLNELDSIIKRVKEVA